MKGKLFRTIVLSLCLLALFVTSVSASTTTLWRHSSNTYVTSYHPDNYFSDYYKGTASVIGTDRISQGNHTYSFAWTRITYDVQGDVSSKTANSRSSTDNVRRSTILEVYDKWNNGSKTKAYYNYGLRLYGSMSVVEE
ncbi:hypothetical protein M3210_15240 [Oceanobacillus luteolus]|uniref:hypothetical protein n=1 Tax=Oceanobacillus luteolus TaxID=1274358 RepID=UPI002040C5D5|nr:hypothetical protein [Oceanobacillus luteolus]MCM3741607.1 hypothetical protein [Oceanobacillus luteolus]